MQAAVFKALGQPLVIETVPDPVPGPDQVVVKVVRAGICGSDLKLTESAMMGLQPGFVLGHEYAGEVVAIGTAVKRIAVGEYVAVFPAYGCGTCVACCTGTPSWCKSLRVDGGGYSQYALTTDRQCVRLPGGLSPEDGALVEPLAVGLHGIAVGGLPVGSRVLVIGAGPIGLTTVFWARRLGAARIAVTARSNRRADLARHMGADVFVEPGEDLVRRVDEALGGPPDIVYECVGAPGLIAQALDHVRPRGTIIVQGACTDPDSFVPFGLVVKEARIQGTVFYSLGEFQYAAEILAGEAALLRAMVTDEIPLAALPQMFEELRHRAHQCKVLVRPNG